MENSEPRKDIVREKYGKLALQDQQTYQSSSWVLMKEPFVATKNNFYV